MGACEQPVQIHCHDSCRPHNGSTHLQTLLTNTVLDRESHYSIVRDGPEIHPSRCLLFVRHDASA